MYPQWRVFIKIAYRKKTSAMAVRVSSKPLTDVKKHLEVHPLYEEYHPLVERLVVLHPNRLYINADMTTLETMYVLRKSDNKAYRLLLSALHEEKERFDESSSLNPSDDYSEVLYWRYKRNVFEGTATNDSPEQKRRPSEWIYYRKLVNWSLTVPVPAMDNEDDGDEDEDEDEDQDHDEESIPPQSPPVTPEQTSPAPSPPIVKKRRPSQIAEQRAWDELERFRDTHSYVTDEFLSNAYAALNTSYAGQRPLLTDVPANIEQAGGLAQLSNNCFANSASGALFLSTNALDFLIDAAAYNSIGQASSSQSPLHEPRESQGAWSELDDIPPTIVTTYAEKSLLRTLLYQGQVNFAGWVARELINPLRTRGQKAQVTMERLEFEGIRPAFKDYIDRLKKYVAPVLTDAQQYLFNKSSIDNSELVQEEAAWNTLIASDFRDVLVGPPDRVGGLPTRHRFKIGYEDAVNFFQWFMTLLPCKSVNANRLFLSKWKHQWGDGSVIIPDDYSLPVQRLFIPSKKGDQVKYSTANPEHQLLYWMKRHFARETLEPSATSVHLGTTGGFKPGEIDMKKLLIASRPLSIVFVASRGNVDDVIASGQDVSGVYRPLMPPRGLTLEDITAISDSEERADFDGRPVQVPLHGGLLDSYELVGAVLWQPGHYSFCSKQLENNQWWIVDATYKEQVDEKVIFNIKPATREERNRSIVYSATMWVYEHSRWRYLRHVKHSQTKRANLSAQ